MARKSPTMRTLEALRSRGMQAGICERWLPHVSRGDGGFGIRRDLFGWIDVIAIDPARGVGGVQSTGTAFSEHWRKLTEERATQIRAWLEAGAWGELWGWRKLKGVWAPRIAVLSLDDFGDIWS